MNTLSKIFIYATKSLDFLMKYFKLLVLLILVILIVTVSQRGNEQRDNEQSEANLAKLYLRGPILQSDEVRAQIERIKSNPNIKGVLLLIDSPGGSIGASIEVANLIKELRDTMPIIAHVEGTMASGSYYSGMYSDRIIANRGAIVGSIGVIFNGFNIKTLLDTLGIQEQTLQEGQYKSIGTPLREWKSNEKEFLQNLLKEQYKMFVDDVIQARNLTSTDPKAFADGKVFSASQALKLGLIDALGSQNQAIQELLEITQVKKAIWLEKSKTRQWLDQISNITTQLISNLTKGQIQLSHLSF